MTQSLKDLRFLRNPGFFASHTSQVASSWTVLSRSKDTRNKSVETRTNNGLRKYRLMIVHSRFNCLKPKEKAEQRPHSTYDLWACVWMKQIWDYRKIMYAPAGCNLMGLAKDALESASVRGLIELLRRER